jgi:hypothetical protein
MQCSPTSGSRPVRGRERYYLWQREIFRFKKRQMQHFQAYFNNCHYKILKEFLYIFLWFCLLRDVEGSLFRNLSILSTIITKNIKLIKTKATKRSTVTTLEERLYSYEMRVIHVQTWFGRAAKRVLLASLVFYVRIFQMRQSTIFGSLFYDAISVSRL